MEAVEETQLDRRIRFSGIPLRYRGVSLATYDPKTAKQRAALEAVTAWSEAPLTDRGFLLTGSPGTGKTHLAAGALLARMDRDSGLRFATVPLLLDRMRAGFRFTDASSDEAFVELCTEARVVVLDDLGAEKSTDWASERLYVLIESRYQAMKPTIVTSNYDLNQLAERGYAAAVSRLIAAGSWLQLDGKDHRIGA